MRNAGLAASLVCVVVVIVGLLLAIAGSDDGYVPNNSPRGIPLFALTAILIFGIQWILFVPAYIFQTEKFFDLTGGVTYVIAMIFTVALAENMTLVGYILALMIIVWALRLSSFLFLRIRRDGFDKRFTTIKPSMSRFFMTWNLQGLWVLSCSSPALAAIAADSGELEITPYAVIGALIWGIGFVLEILADGQKKRFRADPANEGKFITSGLWAWSRHPNYLGEILLWTGILIMVIPELIGWQYITALSVPYTIFMLTKVSGIRMLDEHGDAKWGSDKKYIWYQKNTPALILRPPKSMEDDLL
ncbi:MAG: DUF1295 domain-containing protein [Dehalococcoidia bacterium]|nr:DUF1295 domain-containing protein [Dehalococcoidia bacterium]|tara:strand:- start:1499 stop:2407 length:909 start_codon:yes stop_codon:yes gene_type:complete